MPDIFLVAEYDELALSNYPAVTGGYYAVIHDLYQQSVSNLVIPYALQPFVGASQPDFAFTLIADTQRTHHYYRKINCNDLDLPDNPYGDWYEYEIWGANASGTFNRSLDKLVKVEKFIWLQRMVDSRLDPKEEQAIATLAGIAFPLTSKDDTDDLAGSWGKYFNDAGTPAETLSTLQPIVEDIQTKIDDRIPTGGLAEANYVVHFNAAYDSSLQRLQFLTWLEKDGQKFPDIKKCVLVIYDSNADAIIAISHEPGITPDSGQLNFSQESIELSPDEVYFADVSITTNDDDVYNSGSAMTTWD